MKKVTCPVCQKEAQYKGKDIDGHHVYTHATSACVCGKAPK